MNIIDGIEFAPNANYAVYRLPLSVKDRHPTGRHFTASWTENKK